MEQELPGTVFLLCDVTQEEDVRVSIFSVSTTRHVQLVLSPHAPSPLATPKAFAHAIPSAYSYLLQTYLPTAQQPSNHPPACPPFPASAKTSLTSPQKLSTHLSCH